MEPFFFNVIGCCNFTEVNSREECTVLPVVFLKPNDACIKKCSVWPSSTFKQSIGNIIRRSELLSWSDMVQ